MTGQLYGANALPYTKGNWYPLYRSLGLSWGRSGRFDVQEVSVYCPLIEPRIAQPEAKSVEIYVPTVNKLQGYIKKLD